MILGQKMATFHSTNPDFETIDDTHYNINSLKCQKYWEEKNPVKTKNELSAERAEKYVKLQFKIREATRLIWNR